MNRRTFTFAALALAGTASAAEPQGAQAVAPAAPVEGRWSVKAVPGELTVTLGLVNPGSEPVDVLAQRGSRPGPNLRATLKASGEEIDLAVILDEAGRREMMSRMGPVPEYEAIAAGGSKAFGPYRFTLPDGAEKESFRIVATVIVDEQRFDLAHSTGPASV
jgi:hypothetical protein